MYERIDNCPICSSTDLRNSLICKDSLVTGQSFAICTCASCDLMITNPRPNTESISQFYSSDQYQSHNNDGSYLSRIYSLVQVYTLWYKFRIIRKLNSPGQRLLDYGCGVGQFMEYMSNKKYEVVGIEPSLLALEKTKQKGLVAYETLEQTRESESKFDVITLWHVLEHVHDLNATIKKLRKLLNKDGVLCIAVPNTKSWDAKHYKESWAAYDVPRHLYHFNDTNIRDLFKNHRLTLNKIAPLYLDAFYISLLSESNKTNRQNFLNAIINGCKSSIYGSIHRQYSSMIYLFQKK